MSDRDLLRKMGAHSYQELFFFGKFYSGTDVITVGTLSSLEEKSSIKFTGQAEVNNTAASVRYGIVLVRNTLLVG